MLEKDLEEASTKLNLAHKEIQRLTDELESAHLPNHIYGKSFREIQVHLCVSDVCMYMLRKNNSESELCGAQEEAEQLEHEVEKVKCCDKASSLRVLTLHPHSASSLHIFTPP